MHDEPLIEHDRGTGSRPPAGVEARWVPRVLEPVPRPRRRLLPLLLYSLTCYRW